MSDDDDDDDDDVHHSREHMYSNDYAIAQSLPWWWCGPAASTPSADVSTPSHRGSANGRPSLEGYPRCCKFVIHRNQIWRIGCQHLWSDKIWRLSLSLSLSLSLCSMVTDWQCHVHGERHDFSDVNITSPGKGRGTWTCGRGHMWTWHTT